VTRDAACSREVLCSISERPLILSFESRSDVHERETLRIQAAPCEWIVRVRSAGTSGVPHG